ncbi:hypothetical protein DDE18_08845 [Nocardioides gansuensis]|uniref:Uncharacterized protein n=1 Tax=Nocardioides gansuensis TaxID=2138300 RepID=A0A2T8FCV0_9ACTN|nr:hypothetical protein [Nocardioides gansuensis]PVG83537.1 hypothetical protein DDE18_08845 [Nocardioides gansuensis]
MVRSRVAQIIWLICVGCAVFLALGALLVALKANTDNGLVDFVLRAADAVDLGVFGREGGVWEFTKGKNRELYNTLANWGTGAVVWLVLGRVLDRIIRP